MCPSPLSWLLSRWALQGDGVGRVPCIPQEFGKNLSFTSLTLQSGKAGELHTHPRPPLSPGNPTPQRAQKPDRNPDWHQFPRREEQRGGFSAGTAPGSALELPGFAVCAGCSSLRGPGECLAHLPTPAHSATAPGWHRGRGVDSATRSRASSQLSWDCSAPWQGNARAQRVPGSARKSCTAGRGVTCISSGRKRLGADTEAQKSRRRGWRGGDLHTARLLGGLGDSLEQDGDENLSWKTGVGVPPAQILCVRDRRQPAVRSYFFWDRSTGTSPCTPSPRGTNHGQVNPCWGRAGPSQPNWKHLSALLLPATHV